jgi:hypothetical protein
MAAMQKIEIELTEAEVERLRCEAERRGLPLGATAHDLLVHSLPAGADGPTRQRERTREALARLAELRAKQPMTDVVELMREVRAELERRGETDTE